MSTKSILSVVGLLILIGLAAWTFLPVEDTVSRFTGWISGLGAAGIILFAVIYIVGTLIVGPMWLVSVSAGIAYGFWGIALVVPSATVAATIAFLIARYIAREKVAQYLGDHPRLKAIDAAVREHDFKIILLLRLSPVVPFGAKNYLLGLTGASVRSYVAGTLFGIIPGASLYVYLGVIGRLVATWPQDAIEWAVLIIGLAATAFLVFFIHREARKRLRQLGV